MKMLKLFPVLMSLSAIVAPSDCWAENLLVNPGFEEPNGSPFTPFDYAGSGYGGNSAAFFWGIYNFTSGTTTTELTGPPAGLANSGLYSMAISTTEIDDGVSQGIGNSQGEINSVSGYVYVVEGSVGIGLYGSGGVLTIYSSTATTGQWVFLGSNTSNIGPSSTFEILSLSPNSEFYVDNVDADTNALTPEPASLCALGLGAVGLLIRRRRAGG